MAAWSVRPRAVCLVRLMAVCSVRLMAIWARHRRIAFTADQVGKADPFEHVLLELHAEWAV